MSEEKISIEVPVIRLLDGAITCKTADQQCPFLLDKGEFKGEKIFSCCFLKPKFEGGPRPELISDIDTGWLIPHKECPIQQKGEHTYS